MESRVSNINTATLRDLFLPCRACVYWEYPGLGRRLLNEVIDDLRGRRFHSVQTFARDDSSNNCSGPTKFWLAQGFSVVATESFPYCLRIEPFSSLRP